MVSVTKGGGKTAGTFIAYGAGNLGNTLVSLEEQGGGVLHTVFFHMGGKQRCTRGTNKIKKKR